MRLPRSPLLLLVLACPLAAQQRDTTPAAQDTSLRAGANPRTRAGADCKTGPISYIFIDNHSIFDMNDPGLARRFRWAYRAANRLHVRTRQGVVRRVLLFGVGDCYDPIRIEESARLLRAYDFISQADVYGVAQPDGSYHVIVDTQDNWTTNIDLRLGFSSGTLFQGARFRETNIFGSGQSANVYYIHRQVTRDYGIGYETPQFA